MKAPKINILSAKPTIGQVEAERKAQEVVEAEFTIESPEGQAPPLPPSVLGEATSEVAVPAPGGLLSSVRSVPWWVWLGIAAAGVYAVSVLTSDDSPLRSNMPKPKKPAPRFGAKKKEPEEPEEEESEDPEEPEEDEVDEDDEPDVDEYEEEEEEPEENPGDDSEDDTDEEREEAPAEED